MSKKELKQNVNDLKQDLSEHIKSTTANPYYKVIEKLIGTKNKLALSTFTYCNAMNRIFLDESHQSLVVVFDAKLKFLLGKINNDLSSILNTNNDKVEKILRTHTDDITKIKQIIEIKNKENFYQIGEEQLKQFNQIAKEEIIKCAEDIICDNFSTTIENCTSINRF